MKVFFIGRYNQTEFLTGPEKVAKRIFNEYIKADDSVFIEYFFDGRKYGLLKKLFGKETVEEINSSKVVRFGSIRLFFFLLKEKPSTIHIITFERFSVVSIFYKFVSKVKIIYGAQGISCHENLKYKNVSASYKRKDKFTEKLLFKYSDILFFLSVKSEEIALMYYKIDKSKTKIIPNGVDEIFHTAGKSKIFTEEDPLKIIFIGNINRKEKGFEFLYSSVSKINFPFELHLLSNTIKFNENNFFPVDNLETGNLSRFLSDKDIYISSSEYEPFSMAAAECMSEGLVSIVTCETGMSRYIINGKNGFVVKYNDTDELISVLNFLNSNRSIIPEISREGKKIYSQVSWQTVFEKYKIFYT